MSKKVLSEQEKEKIKKRVIENNIFYSEEIDNYTDDENIIKERIKDIKSCIEDFNEQELTTDKETLLNNNDFLRLIATCINGNNDPLLFNEERLNELIKDYMRTINVFNDDGIDKTLEIVNIYGNVIPKDEDGFYELNDTILDKVIKDNEFYISDTQDKEAIKKEIFNTWENQQEILTQDNLNKYSETRNGLSFKHFIFCEEYLKRGKIKPTCDHLGIARNTAYLWLKDKKVQEYLKSRQDEIKQDNDIMYRNLYNSCFNEISDIINSEYADTTNNIRAISTFLSHYENMERIKTNKSE